jgi:hypothetical protein
MTARPEVRREVRRRLEPANFDEWEAWIDNGEPQAWSNSDLPRADPLPELAVDVDLVAGEFFRGNWRRRLADAEGDCGYVARQMRKAGVPLDLALVILLMPDPWLAAVQTSIVRPVTPPSESEIERLDFRFFWTNDGGARTARNGRSPAAQPDVEQGRHPGTSSDPSTQRRRAAQV